MKTTTTMKTMTTKTTMKTMKTIFIPIIRKDAEANDFTCRDGEIEMMCQIEDGGFSMAVPDLAAGTGSVAGGAAGVYVAPTLELTAEGSYPTANVRIALEKGDEEKARLMLSGEISRVDAATAERLTQAMLEKSAEALLSVTTDLRRQGLFILPFRVYTMTMMADGTLTYPSGQAIALPTDYPPHPEITASSVTSDTMTLSLRFPVRPHRLKVTAGENMPAAHSIRTFISYPLYIPDPKEMKGSIGSVRCATGGNATGIRFTFLTTSALKASVAAPEKYYEMVGNSRTGYRISSKAAPAADYSVYAKYYGYTPPFPESSMLLAGVGTDGDTDVLDWVADWTKSGEGYLPISLPYIYRQPTDGGDETDDDAVANSVAFPDGIDKDGLLAIADELGLSAMMLTRPMALASNNGSRRNSQPTAIRRMHVEGLPDATCVAILYGSHDCRHWQPLRVFNPHTTRILFSPPRLWHRLVLLGGCGVGELARCLALRMAVDYS